MGEKICALPHRCSWRSSSRRYIRISGISVHPGHFLQNRTRRGRTMSEVKNKKKKSSIIQISIGILAVILAILIIIMMRILQMIRMELYTYLTQINFFHLLVIILIIFTIQLQSVIKIGLQKIVYFKKIINLQTIYRQILELLLNKELLFYFKEIEPKQYPNFTLKKLLLINVKNLI